MKADTVLTLGDFEFSRYEIPEHINFGGDHRLAVHELVGGVRIVDAMGRSDAPIEWSGLFFGSSADMRARYLDGLRVAGKPLDLTWGGFKYSVVIQRFEAQYERFYQVPYRITCMVVEDSTQPVSEIASAGVDELIAQDQATADALVTTIGDSSLSSLMGTLDTAIGQVSSFATAAQSTINSVTQPLAAVQGRVGTLLASVNNTVANVSTVGGVLPFNPVATTAGSMLSQVNAMTQLPSLLNLRNVLGRMGSNLSTIGKGLSTVTQAGGDLFTLAAQKFGDVTQWVGIAKANGLTDPQLTGIKTLTIPSTTDTSGGVFGG